MSNHGYPRLCGGTFFTITLQALKQRMGAREHYNSESDGMSDPEVLMGLFKVVNPDFQELDKKKLKGATDGFKSCKAKSSVYLPFGDTQEIRAFDKRVKTQYAEALHDMEAFVDEFIDVGEKVSKHVTLVRALADLVMKDDEIKPPMDEFYITVDGQITKKAAFDDLNEVYLPAFRWASGIMLWLFARIIQSAMIPTTVGVHRRAVRRESTRATWEKMCWRAFV